MPEPARSAGRFDRLRIGRGELENHIIDEFVGGRISRRELLRRGTIAGLSLPALSLALDACGGSKSAPATTAAAQASIGTLRVGCETPSADPNPLTTADDGGATMLAQAGEYLAREDTAAGVLRPILATSWAPNPDATEWTFKLRPNVRFHTGAAMTADDVVYTFQQNSDPKNAANALSVFEGLLEPAGVSKVDEQTVRFTLKTPSGSFPTLISSDLYNCIIVPRGTDFAKWTHTMVGTGPFINKSYTPDTGARFVANPRWWGGHVGPSEVDWSFYASQPPLVIAAEGGAVDLVANVAYQGAQGLFNSANHRTIALKTATHRELSMRTDKPPFNDPRVRRAVALTLDRPGTVNALVGSNGTVGNDHPFSPVYRFSDQTVPQRVQDLSQARELLRAAGYPHGFTATLYTYPAEELATFAQIVKASAAKIGVNINLVVESEAQYFGKATFGNSDWLDGEMSLVQLSHRGVPNVYLGADLQSNGVWNAAHFKDPTYDRLVNEFVAALDISRQRELAGKLERLLLEQTPVIIAYFLDRLTVTSSSLRGVEVDGTPASVYLAGAATA